MIEGVKQQKWWGWGEEGLAYRYEDKPKFPGFVQKMVGVDITRPVKLIPPFSSLDVPASELSDELRAKFVDAIGEKYVQTDDETRVVHAYGKGVRDLIRIRKGDLGRVPDVVLYPGTQEEVEAIVDASVEADAVLIPFGGGSNIVAALEAEPGETRQVISVNLGRMSKVLEIDETSGLPTSRRASSGPTWRTSCRPAAGRWDITPTRSSGRRLAAGSRPAAPACSPTSTATSPTSSAASRWSCPARCSSFAPSRPAPPVRASARWCSDPRAVSA